MHNQPINTNPIIQFIQQVNSADLSNQQEVRLTINNAKILAYSLGIVMARLEGDLEKLVIESKKDSDEIIDLRIDQGGNW
jgi:hypothetical protein|tara:strand:+ start:1330 stop:1569 length:240 start_codon:yes stop_codon:yes gene_type:complete